MDLIRKNCPIPIVDFGLCSLNISDDCLRTTDLENVGNSVCKAFREFGFVYLKNYGISQKQVDEAFSLMKIFNELPKSYKSKYERKPGTGHGWIAMERERLNNNRPYDYKESFNYLPICQQTFPKLSEDVPNFGETLATMYAMCYKLTKRILDSLGHGLKLSDPEYFSRAHNPYTRDNMTALRLLYYPQIKSELQPRQIRCGEHSDWGSITLLFQDNAGGLEVMSDGEFVEATPIPETVLVNIGDLMQRWTGDDFISTIHRVVVPSTGAEVKDRRSMAFFANPDDECEIVTLKGSHTYKEPIKMKTYMEMRMKEST